MNVLSNTNNEYLLSKSSNKHIIGKKFLDEEIETIKDILWLRKYQSDSTAEHVVQSIFNIGNA